MDFPTYPLQHEQRAAIIMDGRTAIDVVRIQRDFAKRRNAEHPGWQAEYETAVQAWLAWQKRPRRS